MCARLKSRVLLALMYKFIFKTWICDKLGQHLRDILNVFHAGSKINWFVDAWIKGVKLFETIISFFESLIFAN